MVTHPRRRPSRGAVDPARGGLWLITTLSGAQYQIDALDRDRSATLTRLTHRTDAPSDYNQANLRRDGEALALLAVQHFASTGELAEGLVLGAEAVFMIEPLGPGAAMTLRRTTAIRSIDRLDTVLPGSGPVDQPGSADPTVPGLVAVGGAEDWSSFTDVAAAVADALDGQADHIFAVLILTRGIVKCRSVTDPAERGRWLTPRPGPTGDPRFDALIAGSVRHLAVEQHLRVPAWADAWPPLHTPWSPFGVLVPPPTRTWRELDELNIVLDASFADTA